MTPPTQNTTMATVNSVPSSFGRRLLNTSPIWTSAIEGVVVGRASGVRPLSTFKLSRHRVMSWTSREEVCKPARSETEAGPEETTGRVATARDTAGAEEPPSLRWRV